MPIRINPIITNNYYHIFNRTYQYAPFADAKLCNRAILCLWYSNIPHKTSISRYLQTARTVQQKIIFNSENIERKVDLLAFCLMPNHFHLLVKQNVDNGISKFVSDFQNSLTQYFNAKNHSLGPLFQRQFKAVLINSKEQLLHVSRYIHLNPYTAKIVHTTKDLINYSYSSLPIYLNQQIDIHKFINRSMLDEYYTTPEKHLTFIEDNKEYQQTLHSMYKQYLDS